MFSERPHSQSIIQVNSSTAVENYDVSSNFDVKRCNNRRHETLSRVTFCQSLPPGKTDECIIIITCHLAHVCQAVYI